MPPLLPPAADPRLAAPPAAPRPPGSEAAAARAARDFEAMALGALLQPMFEGLGKGGAFGGGTAEEMWRPMLVNEFARVIAAGGGLGIADAVMRQMLAMQEQRA
ncbi:chemotaxis protein [Elioraea sp. Yellowstone]|jgi:flagellar protein FlgJ|uniref:rod-binding protein n=1 Tax=Elioraea sp. Yellowstone TaxID=2592070 RepID=UPI0011548222|nr:rod-binding protein [Elioraea sp. Yellowstone]TQF76963.1 chemotaxis protein [Elioraea sp. Yellowstone]